MQNNYNNIYDADKKKGVEKSRKTWAESSKMKGWILQVMMVNLLHYCIATLQTTFTFS